MRDDRPWAVDWKSVMPRKPVKVKPMKLKPADWPRFNCSVPPSRKIIRKGKTTAATRRPGSRKNLSRSRPAMAVMAFSSSIFARQETQIGVLQRCRLCPQHGQGLLDRLHDLVRGAPVEANDEVAIFIERQLESDEPAPQRGAIGGVDVQRFLNQL